ncbi:PREDICTED: adenylate cyclase, terminal-differentiation specific isoform X2 [Drosophila arizonae]|uniref:Adenylate cyclase, terminal-differentiation specific isoform X2 n=1 Tax=Drosophila arizonae TaxID=7263 RepID=A0ABM1PIF7_DROAR|nr:PREDICTED: adenylate cyclase, terminal-differentiation specific isoform X2 [Drosophila arizonae]
MWVAAAAAGGWWVEAAYPISDDELDDLDDDCLLEETELSGSANSIGRGPYERAWTTEATRALIHIRGPMEGSFTEGRQKRTALWLHCTRQLQRLGFRYSAAKVQKKWHNILITYNKNLNKKYVSGYVHWEFFEEMFKYLQGKKADFDVQLQPVQMTTQQQQQQQQQVQAQQQQQQQQLQQQQQQQQQPQQQQQQSKPATPQDGQPYITPVDQVLLQPQVQLQLDSKSNDEFDEDSNSLSEVRQPKLEYDADQTGSTSIPDQTDSQEMAMAPTGKLYEQLQPPPAQQDDIWWKDYFERKLDVEREKMELQRSLQREQLQIQKMSLVQQERIERMKIDAINSLTATLQKLVEAKCRRA